MSDPLRGVIVSHGALATILVEAVAGITGNHEVLVGVSNQGTTPEELCRRVAGAVGSGPAVVFVDMPAGSCLKATLTELRERRGVAVVTGVNLPMLLDFVNHRDLSPEDAARRLANCGREAIRSLQP